MFLVSKPFKLKFNPTIALVKAQRSLFQERQTIIAHYASLSNSLAHDPMMAARAITTIDALDIALLVLVRILLRARSRIVVMALAAIMQLEY